MKQTGWTSLVSLCCILIRCLVKLYLPALSLRRTIITSFYIFRFLSLLLISGLASLIHTLSCSTYSLSLSLGGTKEECRTSGIYSKFEVVLIYRSLPRTLVISPKLYATPSFKPMFDHSRFLLCFCLLNFLEVDRSIKLHTHTSWVL